MDANIFFDELRTKHSFKADSNVAQLTFKKFASHAAFYYTALLALFLFECFKEDVCSQVVPVGSYPTNPASHRYRYIGKNRPVRR